MSDDLVSSYNVRGSVISWFRQVPPMQFLVIVLPCNQTREMFKWVFKLRFIARLTLWASKSSLKVNYSYLDSDSGSESDSWCSARITSLGKYMSYPGTVHACQNL